jgi:magnesium transporter
MRLKFKKEDEDFSVIESETLVIFSGYTKQTLEQIDSDMGMLEGSNFFSSQSHKMNEIMKTLTIVSAIFIHNIYCRCL